MKVQIKQIGRDYDGKIVPIILENRKIQDVDLFFNPNDKDNTDILSCYCSKACLKVFLSHISFLSKFAILIDSDTDGYTSSAILFNYIKKISKDKIDINYILHNRKEHGLTDEIMNKIYEFNPDILIIPDAGSNDIENLKKLIYSGIDVIVIDHHEIVDENNLFPELLIINNQISKNKDINKNLTGAGLSLKFCQACDKYLQTNYAEDFYDLAALGQIADGSDISENEVRNIVFKGLNNIKNGFIKTVLKDYFPNKEKIVPFNLSFSIIPLINSVARIGELEDKKELFRALVENEDFCLKIYTTVIKKKKNKVTNKFDKISVNLNFYEYVLDICKKDKLKQAPLSKAISDNEDLFDNNYGIAIGIIDDSLDKNSGAVMGLAANKMLDKFRKPILILHENKDYYMGSARGYEKVLKDFKSWCIKTNLVKYAQGHSNAFGICIKKENLEKFKELSNELKNDNYIYDVDLILDGSISKVAIEDINNNLEIIGGKVYQPLFAFLNINFEKKYIKKKGNMLTLYKDGIEFIMYNSSSINLSDILGNNFNSCIELSVIGTPSISWSNNPCLILNEILLPKNIEILKDEVTIDNIFF